MRLRRIRGGEIGSRLTTASDASACAPPGGTAARSDHRAPREHVHALQGEYGGVAGVAAVFVFRVLQACAWTQRRINEATWRENADRYISIDVFGYDLRGYCSRESSPT